MLVLLLTEMTRMTSAVRLYLLPVLHEVMVAVHAEMGPLHLAGSMERANAPDAHPLASMLTVTRYGRRIHSVSGERLRLTAHFVSRACTACTRASLPLVSRSV